MQETRFFQKTRFDICQKLDFSRNSVIFGGHFGTKNSDFHLKVTNFGCKRGKLDFKRQKLDFKAKKLSKNLLPPFENGNLMPSHLKGNTLLKNFTDPKNSLRT